MKVLIAGDFAPRARLADQINEEKFEGIFSDDIISKIKTSDYSIVNLESPIVDKINNPISKVGPNLSCSCNTVKAIKYAGFRCVTLANNHIMDYGEYGLKNTIECCEKNEIDIVGVGKNLNDASTILYVKCCNKTLAVINCCEHEYSIATDYSFGANPINAIHQYYKIQEAKEKADYVLVITHGGHEHFQFPSIRMKETYRFFVDAGADAVINHHQHCYSGFEVYNQKPIFYGLGNFAFDINPNKTNEKWNYGYMVELHLFEEETVN